MGLASCIAFTHSDLYAQSRSAEVTFWESVRDSSNAAELQAYLDAYPDGEFAALARIRLKGLKSAPEEPTGTGNSSDSSAHETMPKINRDHGIIGVEIEKVPNAPGEGLKIRGLIPNSSAAVAGLIVGEFIQKVNGQTIESGQQLIELVKKSVPSEVLPIEVRGGTGVRTVDVKLKSYARHLFGLAQQGNPQAMMYLGQKLLDGDVFEKNPKLATYWFKAAKAAFQKQKKSPNPQASDAKDESLSSANNSWKTVENVGVLSANHYRQFYNLDYEGCRAKCVADGARCTAFHHISGRLQLIDVRSLCSLYSTSEVETINGTGVLAHKPTNP